MRFKKQVAVLVVITLIFTLGMSGAICQEQKSQQKGFSDVGTDHWAYEAVTQMSQYKILSGFPDGTFKPGNAVTRGEFAKIMVTALNLKVINPEKQTFYDVDKDNWAYKYAETAKFYLTGFRVSNTDYFRPDAQAVREDMAVALVKALGYDKEVSGANTESLNVFSDQDTISANLKKYVVVALNHNIMEGYAVKDNEAKSFGPQNQLTRAEAAALLYKVIKAEKITYDEEKVVYENNTASVEEYKPIQETTDNTKPSVSGKIDGGKIILNWNAINSNGLQGYKVVISKSNSSPKYPDDGYLYWITDKNKTSAIVDNSSPYNSGDFGKYLVAGQKYYFSITAVYGDRKVAGNVIALTYPGESKETVSTQYATPSLTGSVQGGSILLKWKPIYSDSLQGYKVVISKYNSKPKYPDEGYLYWITDKSQATATVESGQQYNGGDFGGNIKAGEKYYFSITALYNDRKIPGNVITLTVPNE